MRFLIYVIVLAAAAITGCGQQAPTEPVETNGVRCISYTDSEIYPQYRMTCWCEVEEDGEWVECTPPEVLQ